MPYKRHNVNARNAQIKARYEALEKKHPQWKYAALIDALSREFYLMPSTIQKILNEN